MSLPFLASSQSCAQMLAAAKKSEQAGQFRDAIMKYNAAARKCGPARKADIDGKVLEVFDRIEALRSRAEKAEQKATQEATRAKKAESAAEERSRSLDSLLYIVKAEKDRNERIINRLYFYKDYLGLAVNQIATNKFLYGFIDKQGNVRIPLNYDEAKAFEPKIGFARVVKDGRKYFLNERGNEFPLAETLAEITPNTVALDLRDQKLTTLPDSLFDASKIAFAFLSGNRLSNISEKVSNWSNLRILDLSNNTLSNIPERIGQLQELRLLKLNNNQIKTLPPQFYLLRQLLELDLSNNQLEAISEGIGQLDKLWALYLDNNKLKKLPYTIGNLTQLDILGLAVNQLESLPSSIGKLAKLEDLYASNNKLRSLPPEIGQLTKLVFLELTDNQLTTIPESIGNLKKLEDLSLENNQLMALPETIGELQKLSWLSIDNNKLQDLPRSVWTLSNLETIYVEDNPFRAINNIPPLTNEGQVSIAKELLGAVEDSIYRYKRMVRSLREEGMDFAEPMTILNLKYEQTCLIAKAIYTADSLKVKKDDITDLFKEWSSFNLEYGNYQLSEKVIRDLIAFDSSIDYYLYLPLAILFQGRYEEAEELISQWKDYPSNVYENFSVKQVLLNELKYYKENNLVPESHKAALNRFIGIMQK